MEGEGARSPPGAAGGAEEWAQTPGNMIGNLPEFDVAGCDELKINLSIPKDYDYFQHNESLMGRKTDYDFELYTIKLRRQQDAQEKQPEAKLAEEPPKYYDASKHMHKHDNLTVKKNAEPKNRKESSYTDKTRGIEEKSIQGKGKTQFKSNPAAKAHSADAEGHSVSSGAIELLPAKSQTGGIGIESVTCKPAFSLKERQDGEKVHKLVPKMMVNLDVAEQKNQAPKPENPPEPECKYIAAAYVVVLPAKPESSGKFKLMLNCIEIEDFPAQQQGAPDECKIEIVKAESKTSKGLKLSASPRKYPKK